MPQFLIPPGKKPDDRVAVSPEESRHATKVLRLERGARVRLTDGAGGLFTGRVETITPKQTIVWIEARLPVPEPKAKVILAQGLLKGDKMEFVIQKAAELGAFAVLPFTSSRTVSDWKGDSKKLQRWGKIAEAASKQCGRAAHLEILEPLAFTKALDVAADAKIAFWEESPRPAKDFLRGQQARSLLVLVGPEGGLSKMETDEAVRGGFTLLSMGSLILRAETAAISALSVIQYELDNF
ncbi:MAG TPA: RsmE family RNA methyltransferase [bacterium]|nr:RsmE family RNA methyltransferase [bacterium]